MTAREPATSIALNVVKTGSPPGGLAEHRIGQAAVAEAGVARTPLARRRTISESGGRPVPASRIRPRLSRTIDVTRMSRPARDTRATPLLPNRVSSVPSARRRITEPRGVPVSVRSVPATSVVVDGPRLTADAPIPAPAARAERHG